VERACRGARSWEHVSTSWVWRRDPEDSTQQVNSTFAHQFGLEAALSGARVEVTSPVCTLRLKPRGGTHTALPPTWPTGAAPGADDILSRHRAASRYMIHSAT